MDLRVAEILTGDSVKVAQVQQIDGNDRRHWIDKRTIVSGIA
jgi:hypothetical protein